MQYEPLLCGVIIMRITSQKKVKEYLDNGFKIETYTPAHFGTRTLYYLTNYKDLEVTVPEKTIRKMMENNVVDENLCYRPNAT